MTPKKMPAAVETATSTQNPAIVAEPHTGRKLNPTTICAGNKPPRRNERRKARDRKRWPDRSGAGLRGMYPPDKHVKTLSVDIIDLSTVASAHKGCYDSCKPKGPVLKTPFGSAVAGPTVSGLLSRPEFSGDGFSQSRMVLGWMVANRKAPAWLIPCFDIQPTRRAQNAASGFKSRSGAKTMTQAFATVRPAAPIQSQADITDPHVIALRAAAENALSMALSMLRSSAGTAADLQRATGRVIRAATLLKRACAAQAQGVAA